MTSPTPETPRQAATRIIADTLQWPANEREGATVLGDDDVTRRIDALTRAGIIPTRPDPEEHTA